MTQIIQEKLKDKTNNLLEIYQGLKKLQRLKASDFENLENIWAVSFGIVAGIEAMLDISQYILTDKNIKAESYGQIPQRLLEAKIINKNFSEKFQKMIGFRNRIIHNYPSLDIKGLYKILKKDIDDFKIFLKAII
ncbi:MAG: DUF86 domain-containing protein [Candidatus Jacksonbacteria bacterium]